MTTAAIVPAKGRFPLLTQTLYRLKHINKIDHVIVVGDETQVEQIAIKQGCDYIEHPNYPLAKKWNHGWEYAMHRYDPDAYVFAGSSDWLCKDYLDTALKELQHYDMVGMRGMYLFDLGANENRLCYWKGYTNERKDESIGIGRVLSRDIVRKMKGRPFRDDLNNTLDYSMHLHVLSFGGKIGLIDVDIKPLSISCYKWSNKHLFEDHWSGKLLSEQMNIRWMDQHFCNWKDINIFEP